MLKENCRKEDNVLLWTAILGTGACVHDSKRVSAGGLTPL